MSARLYGTMLAFDVMNKDTEFPELAAFEVAHDLGLSVTTHAGVWGGHVHRHGIGASLSIDSSAWFSSNMFSAMRSTVNAARAHEYLVAHQNGRSVSNVSFRVKDAVGLATRDGAKALGKFDETGSLEVGKLADVVLVKNDQSPTFASILNPYGHLVFQACRGDVHTVLVGGRVVKSEGALVGTDLGRVTSEVENTVDYLQRELGDEWEAGMHPELPATEILANPYLFQRDGANASSQLFRAGKVMGVVIVVREEIHAVVDAIFDDHLVVLRLVQWFRSRQSFRSRSSHTGAPSSCSHHSHGGSLTSSWYGDCLPERDFLVLCRPLLAGARSLRA